jgi:hypothetical protein
MPVREGSLDAYEVSPAVNHVANDNPQLIAPFTGPAPTSVPSPEPGAETNRGRRPEKDERQGSLF